MVTVVGPAWTVFIFTGSRTAKPQSLRFPLVPPFCTPGPAIPSPPMSLAALHVFHNAATIVWVVTEVAYTSENYIVQYGTDANDLANASPLVDGGIDFSAVDQQFETNIEGLETDTKYYFTVLAINSEGNVSSIQGTFTTLELREYKGINSVLQRTYCHYLCIVAELKCFGCVLL